MNCRRFVTVTQISSESEKKLLPYFSLRGDVGSERNCAIPVSKRCRPCEGRVGQFRPEVEIGTANAYKRGVRAFVAICEGHRPRLQQPHKLSANNGANLLQRYALKRKIIQPERTEKTWSKNKQVKQFQHHPAEPSGFCVVKICAA